MFHTLSWLYTFCTQQEPLLLKCTESVNKCVTFTLTRLPEHTRACTLIFLSSSWLFIALMAYPLPQCYILLFDLSLFSKNACIRSWEAENRSHSSDFVCCSWQQWNVATPLISLNCRVSNAEHHGEGSASHWYLYFSLQYFLTVICEGILSHWLI